MTTKFAIKLLRKDGVVADFPLLDERDFVEEPVGAASFLEMSKGANIVSL